MIAPGDGQVAHLRVIMVDGPGYRDGLLGAASTREPGLVPDRLRAGLLAGAYRSVPLLRPALSAIWLVAVLGWFSEDSGVTVPAAALPFLLPLVAVILSAVPRQGAAADAGERAAAAAAV